jgi:hypothetical protein
MRSVSLDELTIDDERAFAHVALYGRLKQALRQSDQRFLVPDADESVSWDRALFLNLTYWTGDDVLCEERIPADVVAHVAWHTLAARALPPTGATPAASALFFGESIASAFDVYLVGRLLPNAPDSDFITTQVPIMSDCAQAAGISEAAFTALLEEVARAPEAAFAELRALLFDAASALYACADARAAHAALARFDAQRFGPLLHHFQLSNWILYARAYAGPADDDRVQALDTALRQAPVALDWLAKQWLPAE